MCSLYLRVAGLVYIYIYLPMCVHTYVHGVCIYMARVGVCLPIFCAYIPLCLWWLHRCGVRLLCLCAHVCAGAGKHVHLRYGSV